MAKKVGLGRGLSSLISTPVSATPSPVQEAPANQDRAIPETTRSEGVQYMDIASMSGNPGQPRQTFTQQELQELADSIKIYGVLQPILVRPQEGGKFEIIAGERRFRAASMLGLSQVPVLIRELSDKETLEIALIENIQRQNLNPIEEARAYQKLMDAFSLTSQEVAERVGKDRATVSNAVRILRLPPSVVAMVESGELSAGHAKAILTVKEPMAQVGLAEKVRLEHLSVRALEAIVSREVLLGGKGIGERKQAIRGGEKATDGSNDSEVLDRLRLALGTKVSLRKGSEGAGVIEVHYHSESEFERLLEILTAAE